MAWLNGRRVRAGLLGLVAALIGAGVWLVGGARLLGLDEPTQKARRMRMVAEQIEARGIKDPAVLKAMRTVPRHRFVPGVYQMLAYEDQPLPIGEGQTISQPVVVAQMTSLIHPNRSMRVLEIGTGSGYQAAVLAECVGEVETIEILPELGRRAEKVLKELGYRNVHVRIGDGYDGWPPGAPYDAILLTAAPERVPSPLLDQLKVGGKLVAPVGRGLQNLVVMTKTKEGITTEILDLVQFVPMTGKAQDEAAGPASPH
jgi:protein-L-isoaspartate(D-aspartate) O-methyltransferase